jgi:hypothetical protein
MRRVIEELVDRVVAEGACELVAAVREPYLLPLRFDGI